MLLIIHLLLGFRRLRETDYYRDDPIVLRLMGLRKTPDVSTISRTLSKMEPQGIENLRILSRTLVVEALQRERFSRITLDFDGFSFFFGIYKFFKFFDEIYRYPTKATSIHERHHFVVDYQYANCFPFNKIIIVSNPGLLWSDVKDVTFG